MKKFLLLLLMTVSFALTGFAEESKFDFSNNYGMTPGNDYVAKNHSISNDEGFHLIFNNTDDTKANANVRLWTNSAIRMYKTSYFTLEAPAGATITQVELKNGVSAVTTMGTSTDASSKLSKGIWTGSTTEPISFYYQGTSNASISTITITYTPGTGGNEDAVAKPVLTFVDNYDLSMSCETEGNSIYYTTNGDEPTKSSTLYNNGEVIDLTDLGTGNYTIKAVAYATVDGEEKSSAISTGTVTVPTIITKLVDAYDIPTTQAFLIKTPTSVFFVDKGGAYITDGLKNYYLYKSTTLTVGSNFSRISTKCSVYNDLPEGTTSDCKSGEVAVTVPNAKIVTDLSEIKVNDWLYDVVTVEGVTISGSGNSLTATLDGKTITIFVRDSNLGFDPEDDVSYTVTAIVSRFGNEIQLIPMEITKKPRVANVTFAPASGTDLYGTDAVTLSCSTEGATIWYTINDAKGEFIEYNNAFSFTEEGDYTIYAYASADGMVNSQIASATYSYYTAPTCGVVKFSPANEAVIYGKDVITLSCTTADATILYSIEGEDYVTYTEPFTLLGREDGIYTIKAYATREGYKNSESEATYEYYVIRTLPIKVKVEGYTSESNGYTIKKGQRIEASADGATAIHFAYDFKGDHFYKDFVEASATWAPRSGEYTNVVVSADSEDEYVAFEEVSFDLNVVKSTIGGSGTADFIFSGDNANASSLAKPIDTADNDLELKATSNSDANNLTLFTFTSESDAVEMTFRVTPGETTTTPSRYYISNDGKTVEARLYQKHTLTIAGKNGAKITKVTFTKGSGGKWEMLADDSNNTSTYVTTWTSTAPEGVDAISFHTANGRSDIAAISVEYSTKIDDAELVDFKHSDPVTEENTVSFDYTLLVANHFDARDEYSVEVTLNETKNSDATITRTFYEHTVTAVATAEAKPGMRKEEAVLKHTHEVAGSAEIVGLKDETTYDGSVKVYLNENTVADGEYTVNAPIATGIFTIDANGVCSEIEWYDLSGRRVVAPANGIYIKKYGNAVTKHMFQ